MTQEDKLYDDELAAARRKVAIDKQLEQDKKDEKKKAERGVKPFIFLIVLASIVWYVFSSDVSSSDNDKRFKVIHSNNSDGYLSFAVWYDNLKVDKFDIEDHAKNMPWTGKSTIVCYFDDQSKIPDISKAKEFATGELQEFGYNRYCYWKYPNGNSNFIFNDNYGVSIEELWSK